MVEDNCDSRGDDLGDDVRPGKDLSGVLPGGGVDVKSGMLSKGGVSPGVEGMS